MSSQEVSNLLADNRELKRRIAVITHQLNEAISIINANQYTLPISTSDHTNHTSSSSTTYYHPVPLIITDSFVESSYNSLLISLRIRLFTSDLFNNNNTSLQLGLFTSDLFDNNNTYLQTCLSTFDLFNNDDTSRQTRLSTSDLFSNNNTPLIFMEYQQF